MSLTIALRIKNNSDRAFTFGSSLVRVLNSTGDPLKSLLTLKKGKSFTVATGEELEASLQVLKHRWIDNGNQDLILEMKEASSVARVFRLAF
ncbi:hypothetical protein V2H45_08265 [Tumidithrix elongata RA019]|uniref:Uncharacterized protein n=1 Tax=Tumidithrix elongata BACA0141 TaxID=2716417 RepID=A0AAW9PRM2_9CYAN|nr:hypothetical protein [Tumidithrix elongata RA019]